MGKGIRRLFSRRGEEALQKILNSNDGVVHQKEEIRSPKVRQEVMMIRIDDIAPNPFQPRKYFDGEKLTSLAESLKDRGMLHPVTLRKTDVSSGFSYELIFGERRLRAAKEAGMTEVPAIIKDVIDKDMKALTLVENLQREDLNVAEKMLSIGALHQEFGDTSLTADAVRLTQRSVERYVRIFKIVSSSETVLSLFERNAHLIDFSDAEAMADILQSLNEEEMDKFLGIANSEGVKSSIRHFHKSIRAGRGQKTGRAVLCMVKETEDHISLQMKYEKDSKIEEEDRERILNTFEDFLARLKQRE